MNARVDAETDLKIESDIIIISASTHLKIHLIGNNCYLFLLKNKQMMQQIFLDSFISKSIEVLLY